MRGYDRDEYEDLDEYEEEGEEQEEEDGEDEEEEVRLPTKEELEYLEARQRLKESIRKQIKKESGSVLTNSREKNSKMPNDTFGSFFGPSQPVIAQRVIQESKSLLENPHLAARVSKGNSSLCVRFKLLVYPICMMQSQYCYLLACHSIGLLGKVPLYAIYSLRSSKNHTFLG